MSFWSYRPGANLPTRNLKLIELPVMVVNSLEEDIPSTDGETSSADDRREVDSDRGLDEAGSGVW